MNEDDFEGSLVLEKLALIDKRDEFFDAIDNDDFRTARRLMQAARIDPDTIAEVLKRMEDPGDNH